MSSMTLDDWNAQFADEDGIALFRVAQERSHELQLDVAYKVNITGARVVKSARGDIQLELKLDVMDGEDVLAQRREWVTLPKQMSDLKLTRENVEKATQRRFDDLLRILGAAWPEQFARYKEKTSSPSGKDTFIGFDGKPITGNGWAERDAQRRQACIEYADRLHGRVDESIDEMEGTSLYLVKATNKRDARYPYTNWYDAQPAKVPMFSKTEG